MALTTKEFAPKKWWQRRAFLVATGAAFFAIGALTLPLFLAVNTSQESATDLSSATATAGAPSVPSTTAAKGSLVPQIPDPAKSPSDADWLTAAPQGISWQRVDGVPLPFSSSDGPTRIDGAVAEGYTHSPQGAALAAIQIGMRMIYSPDFTSVVTRQTAITNTERDQLIQARTSQPSINSDAVLAATMQPVGFKIGAYSDTDATIYYAYRGQGQNHRIARMAVTWIDGDWKYTGRMSPQAPALPPTADISTFTAL